VPAPDALNEITIKVPAPFAGVSDLGFTAQYHGQERFARPRDVPLLIEGPASPLERLANRLRILREGTGGPYEWSDPIMLSDEVVVIAFRDRSLGSPASVLADGARSSLDYVFNLVRPVVFPFLQDCAKFAQLRLSERIEMRVSAPRKQIAELQLRLEQIVQPNGEDLLWPV
jgi:hypothetical protein